MYEKRRKNIGEKRVDISEACREMIVQAYGEFNNKEYYLGDRTVESKYLRMNHLVLLESLLNDRSETKTEILFIKRMEAKM